MYAQTQDTTEVYTSLYMKNDPLRAQWRPVFQQVGAVWQLSFYDKKGIIQETISYADKDLKVRQGLYLRYLQGKLVEKGNYDKGYKHGEWLYINESEKTNVVFYRYGKHIEEKP